MYIKLKIKKVTVHQPSHLLLHAPAVAGYPVEGVQVAQGLRRGQQAPGHRGEGKLD